MKLRLHPQSLTLEFPFTIARGSISRQRTLIVELEHEGHRGFGEAPESTYYGRTQDSISASLQQCRDTIESLDFQHPTQLWQRLQAPLSEDSFALSAVDQAAWDLFGKQQRKTTWELLELQWGKVPDSSYTIGIDAIDVMVRKLKQHPQWPVYKIKLGTDHDVDIVRALRDTTSAAFRVDANCGWSAEETIACATQLKSLGVEFIEQPLPANAPVEQHTTVYEQSALPLIADESCVSEADVESCAGRFHGINVKLCKCGGLTPAVRMLRQARELGLTTMVGCMVETSVGISAAAQLLPLLDYADLDGAALLAVDPAHGVRVTNGHIEMGRGHGHGLSFPFQQSQP